MKSGINTDPPEGKSIDFETLVDAVDPAPDEVVVFPARHPNQREFKQFHPYEWIDDEDNPE